MKNIKSSGTESERDLIGKVVGEFSTQFRKEFSMSMSNAFDDLNNVLDSRLAASSNQSFADDPSQAPVLNIAESDVLDTPNLNPVYMPSGHGGAEESPELESSSLSPSVLSFLASLAQEGIEVSASVLALLGKGGDQLSLRSRDDAQSLQGMVGVAGAAGAATA